MNDKIPTLLAQLRAGLERLYGERLVRVILFGSRARGDADPDSDIDVLVVLHGPVSPWEEIARTEDLVADLSLEHAEVLACVFMSETEFEEDRTPLLLNVRREGVPV
jgi:uncharacterized protein